MGLNLDRLERLLHEEEGATLDFKHAQYPFEGADDVVKSELLKDILAFANTPRQSRAYILIGVGEVRGGRSCVVGVGHHLDDAKLQQFVNKKTNKTVRFSYKPLPVEGAEVGVLEILPQVGPVYLTSRYGKIEKGTVYWRVGSSTAIASPDEIIEISEQERLRPKTRIPEVDTLQMLRDWHEKGNVRFQQILTESGGVNWPVSMMGHHYQFSYLISKKDDEVAQSDSLKSVLEKVISRIHHPNFTWRMFNPLSYDPDAVAKFVPENPDGSGGDVIEVNLTTDPSYDNSLPDFWRVTPDGRATLIRAYREDRQCYAVGTRVEGTWLSPKLVTLEVAELVAHARLFAHHFNAATGVLFLCTWTGLKGRILDDIQPNYYLTRYNYRAEANQRITECKCTISELATDWKAIVAKLSCSVLRLFDFHNCDHTFVEESCREFSILDD